MQAFQPVRDAVVIGGGFYGSVIALYLARKRGFRKVTLIEREPALMTRASYRNQARVHNGYHYPRSFTTAFRSRVNLPRFLGDWPEAIDSDFTKLYAIARRHSKVTARQFERFCREIGARLRPAPSSLKSLFDSRLIEDAFIVDEYAFDTRSLAEWAARELATSGIEVILGTRVTAIAEAGNASLRVTLDTASMANEIESRYVFNCTYSGMNQFVGDFPGTRTSLKHEITEMALVRVPPALERCGITVMDGPFFSIMPFPARGLHTLSHVRYTPHLQWIDRPDIDPYQRLASYPRASRFDRMIRDAARIMPIVGQARFVESMFEVKTVLAKNEGDDGRPILFERHAGMSNCFSILGGKIDNIYDVLARLDEETLDVVASHVRVAAMPDR